MPYIFIFFGIFGHYVWAIDMPDYDDIEFEFSTQSTEVMPSTQPSPVFTKTQLEDDNLELYYHLSRTAFNILYNTCGETNPDISDDDLTQAAKFILQAALIEPWPLENEMLHFLSSLDSYLNLTNNQTIYSMYATGIELNNQQMIKDAIDLFKKAWETANVIHPACQSDFIG